MTSDVLARARALVAGGWNEPMSLNAQGFICTATDEGLARVCVVDALELAARGDVSVEMAAGERLEQQVRLTGWTLPLYRWLEEPARTHADVLQLFARAQARARAEESRR